MFNYFALQQFAPPEPPSGDWGPWLRVVFVLAAILCLCYWLLAYLKRRSIGVRDKGAAGRLELVDRLGLEPRRSVYLVRAGSQLMAVASWEGGIGFLMEIRGDKPVLFDRSDLGAPQ